MPRVSAASRMDRPAKYRSLTNCACGGCCCSSLASASSSASSFSSCCRPAISSSAISTRFRPPSRFLALLDRAVSTRMRRMASAAAAKKWPRPFHACAWSTSTKRRYASWTRAVAWSVWPGFSRASLCAASLRNSSYTRGSSSATARPSPPAAASRRRVRSDMRLSLNDGRRRRDGKTAAQTRALARHRTLTSKLRAAWPHRLAQVRGRSRSERRGARVSSRASEASGFSSPTQGPRFGLRLGPPDVAPATRPGPG